MVVGTPGGPLKFSSKFMLPPKIYMPKSVKMNRKRKSKRARYMNEFIDLIRTSMMIYID